MWKKIKTTYDEHDEISVTSRWRDVQDLLRENETFRWLSKLEALTSWEEWIAETEKKELEARSKSKFRHERMTRDGFRELLKESFEQGKLKTSTLWQDFVKDMVDHPKYGAMIGQSLSRSGSTPHDLFDDFIEELNEKYKEDRAKIKKIAKGVSLIVTSSSTYEWFHDQLKKDETFLQISEETRKSVFESLRAKAKEQDEDMEKNAKKNRKRFVELLQKTRDVTASTTYEQASKLLGSSSAWDAVDEHTRKQCFDIFVDQLKIQSAAKKGNDGGDKEAGESDVDQKGKKKKKVEKEKVSKKRKHEEPPDDEEEEPEKKPKKHKKK